MNKESLWPQIIQEIKALKEQPIIMDQEPGQGLMVELLHMYLPLMEQELPLLSKQQLAMSAAVRACMRACAAAIARASCHQLSCSDASVLSSTSAVFE